MPSSKHGPILPALLGLVILGNASAQVVSTAATEKGLLSHTGDKITLWKAVDNRMYERSFNAYGARRWTSWVYKGFAPAGLQPVMPLVGWQDDWGRPRLNGFYRHAGYNGFGMPWQFSGNYSWGERHRAWLPLNAYEWSNDKLSVLGTYYYDNTLREAEWDGSRWNWIDRGKPGMYRTGVRLGNLRMGTQSAVWSSMFNKGFAYVIAEPHEEDRHRLGIYETRSKLFVNIHDPTRAYGSKRWVDLGAPPQTRRLDGVPVAVDINGAHLVFVTSFDGTRWNLYYKQWAYSYASTWQYCSSPLYHRSPGWTQKVFVGSYKPILMTCGVSLTAGSRLHIHLFGRSDAHSSYYVNLPELTHHYYYAGYWAWEYPQVSRGEPVTAARVDTTFTDNVLMITRTGNGRIHSRQFDFRLGDASSGHPWVASSWREITY